MNSVSGEGVVAATTTTAMKAELMKVAKNFFKSGKTFDFIETKENGKDCLLAVMTWGSNYFNAGTQTVCVGTDKGSKIEKMWEDCVEQAQIEYLTKQINKGRLHTNYIQANTMQEAWWQVCQVLLGKGTFSANN